MPGKKVPEEARREDILRAAYDVAARRGIEALTLRAVAKRAEVSHGTVLFHFKRRNELVSTLLDRLLYTTATLPVTEDSDSVTRPSERLRSVLKSEMQRLSGEARHFRLFLECWTLGVRNPTIRRRISSALDGYRGSFASLAEAAVNGHGKQVTPGQARTNGHGATPAAIAAVAVSVVHGCALQALVDPRGFSLDQHLETASQLLDGFLQSTAQNN